MIYTYRLKKYFRFYKKGNLIHWDKDLKVYHNHALAVFTEHNKTSFTKEYIINNPEIFEPYE